MAGQDPELNYQERRAKYDTWLVTSEALIAESAVLQAEYAKSQVEQEAEIEQQEAA